MYIYNNIHSFVNFVSTVAGRSSCSDGSESGDDSFYGTKSFLEAKEIFEKGYNEPLEELKDFFISYKSLYNNKSILINDYKGSRPNIGRYLRGLPRQMKRYKKEQTSNNNLSLFIDVSIACCVELHEKIAWGKKIISIINTLQNKGINLELYVGTISGEYTTSKEPNEAVAIKVKSFAEPINILSLCFPICHPSFFRRFDQIHFTATVTKSKKSWGDSYPAYNTSIDCQKYIDDNLNKNSLYINYKNISEVIKKIEQK